MEAFDVVIVGARCAGSAAATALARIGRRIVVLDKARFPSDTLSSHTIFTPAMKELDQMGALADVWRLNPPPLRGAHLEFDNGVTHAIYREQLPAGAPPMAISAPRLLLDEVLVDTACKAGANIREGCTVTDMVWQGGRAAGVRYVDRSGTRRAIAANLVLGADGNFSTVAELVGSSVPYRYSHTDRAAVYRYFDDPVTSEPDATTIYFWRNGISQAFAFPTAPRGSIIAMFISDRSEADFARADPEAYWQGKLHEHPGAAQRLRGATGATPLRITDALSSYFRKSSGPGWALIGDAGHFKDPAIGQGIRDALWAGRTVAQTVAPVLDEPAALDAALRHWEHDRDRECLLPYLAGVYESRLAGESTGLIELIRALGGFDIPLAPALAGRDGTLRKELTPKTVAEVVAKAVRTSPNRAGCAADLLAEAKLVGRMILSARRARFRDERTLAGFEDSRAGWPRDTEPTRSSGNPARTRFVESVR